MSGSSYPLADAMSSIRNCVDIFVGRKIVVPHSGFVVSVLQVLESVKYISKFEVVEKSAGVKTIEISPRFNKKNKNVLAAVKMISKPGCRVYATVDELKAMKNRDFARVVLVSTTKGVVTISKALELKVGGEVLCKLFD